MILTIKTDQPEAEVALYNDFKKLASMSWQAHRELSATLHQKIKQTLEDAAKNLTDIKAIIIYKGPGSFTGLRIGISVANSLAYSLDIPIVGQSGNDWIQEGTVELKTKQKFAAVLPEYGLPAHTTIAKK